MQNDITDPAAENLRRAAIDRSVKGPVLFLFLNAAFWLMAATLLGFLAAVKLVKPDFLGNAEFLTYGRVQPAHLSSLVAILIPHCTQVLVNQGKSAKHNEQKSQPRRDENKYNRQANISAPRNDGRGRLSLDGRFVCRLGVLHGASGQTAASRLFGNLDRTTIKDELQSFFCKC